MKISLFFIYLAFITAACSKSTESAAQHSTLSSVNYKESTEDFANPERGFYRYTETKASDFTPLLLSQLREWRGLTPASNGNYSVFSTLVFRYFIIDNFKDKPLSPAFINSVKADFTIARTAGVKLIARFTYTNNAKPGNCPEGFICPPYGDAPKAIVLQHIAQLKDVFYDNADVIACVQMGFVGMWGEQYYTDYFGDASNNAEVGKLTDQNWKDRIEVLKSLLDAVPKERMVQVRYPQLKQRAIYGINALTNVAVLTDAEAFSESDKARIGFHNDCLLASPDDFGTYEDYGNSTSGRKTDILNLKKYTGEDSRFVVVGGETCNDTYSPQNDCGPTGTAQVEMAALHYSFLNCAYNNDVNNDWQTGGCMQDIKKKLGYRFVLQSASFPKEISLTQSISFTLEIENKGYAACYNERPVMLVLRNAATGQQYFVTTQADPRQWAGGKPFTLKSTCALPTEVVAGKYELLLFLPDKYTSIADRPEYAIRFANDNMWENTTGFNKLNVELLIKE